MTLIKSISGMRGTLGGQPGTSLTPLDIVQFSSAYGRMLIDEGRIQKVVIGRDGRISGPMVQELVTNTLLMMGISVIDLGLSTTPTVEMEVTAQSAGGGIIVTASHNPMDYNALKFLNEKGEFINAEEGQKLISIASADDYSYCTASELGQKTVVTDAIHRHVSAILALDVVNADKIKDQKLKLVADCINSSGALAIPILCEALGVECVLINQEISGKFAHNPEPLAKNLGDLCAMVKSESADLGVALDPDVDRLAFVDEQGEYCGEEYTLVMVADYILSKTPGATVSNLSSTKALRDITEGHGQSYYAAAVGEVNVVTKMRSVDAIIGGEGNGGIIYPTLHAGRDALVGIAVLLTALAEGDQALSALRSKYPEYTMVKDKIQLTPDLDVDALLSQVADHFSGHEIDLQDGVKVYINDGWVHMRKSNTEPIIRLYIEGPDETTAQGIKDQVESLIGRLL